MPNSDKEQREANSNKRYDFNYFITRFFLKNTRLTILALIFFIVVGVLATLGLKTTGFPSPSVPIAIIQTVYPGATSETIEKEVTIPLEGALKDVDGVKRFSSFSQNSVSVITATLQDGSNQDIVQSQIDTALQSVELPEDAQDPKISSPDIGGPDSIYAIVTPDNQTTWELYQKIEANLNQIENISSIQPVSDLNKQIKVKIDNNLMKEKGLDINTVQATIQSFGEEIPALSSLNLDSRNTTISTSLNKNSLDDLRNLTFQVSNQAQANGQAPQPQFQAPTPSNTPVETEEVKLTNFAEIVEEYNWENNQVTRYTINLQDEDTITLPSLILNVKGVEGSDQNQTSNQIKEQIEKISDINYIKAEETIKDFSSDKNYFVEGYSQNNDNQEQVSEVISGLVGSNIDGLGTLGGVGFLLGGIQLVFLVMLFLVSWRAAIISALAIPLSFFFSTIYLYLTGNSLNTLTLFSLVLVTGLVVDPALVVLEAIQRKRDSGLKRQEAVLEAIRDVGMGLFLAMVTNIVVFAPFGLISGVFGQIFAFIPLTIIPAVVGSYLIPLVVLAWFGGLILKRNKKATGSEEDNLWSIAKSLIKINEWILNSSRIVRTLIVVAAIVIPVSITAWMFSAGYIESVQFASSDDSQAIAITANYLSKVPQSEKNQISEDILNEIGKKEEIQTILPLSTGINYYAFLSEPNTRDKKADEIVEEITDYLSKTYGDEASSENKKFFDIQVASEQAGGPASDYQVSIAVKTQDLEKLRNASLEVGRILREEICLNGNQISIDTDCADGEKSVIKVDDGFSEKENTVIDFVLDRTALQEKELASPGRGLPFTIAVNQSIREQFEYNQDEKVTDITQDGVTLPVILEPQNQPTNLEEVKNNLVESLELENLDEIGQTEEKNPKASIQRIRGQVTGIIQAKLKPELQNNQGLAGQILNTAISEARTKTEELGLEEEDISTFSDGSQADSIQAFAQLFTALILAIVISYIVLAIFFNSFLQPLTILYTIPTTFLGVFPALWLFVGGQFGFLEIIGLIILIGIVENVAIFLIDGANQKIREEGWNPKKSIAYASGVRLRPVVLTTITTLVSLTPLAITSDFYRSISVVVIFGLLASGFVSLITTPILYIFFRWLSSKYRSSKTINKILFLIPPLSLGYIAWWMITHKRKITIMISQNEE